MFYEEEFNEMVKEFSKNLKKHKKDLQKFGFKGSYSILGSPLKKSNVLIVGNNWGGYLKQSSQKIMPMVNEILCELSIPT